MDDQQLWQHGLRSANRLLINNIPLVRKQLLEELLVTYRWGKESLVAITLAVDSDTSCRDCAGQCCLNGKYRMNILDVLSHCAAGVTVIPDFSQKPLCPYGTVMGCTMEPEFRPADCVFFICDILDNRLSDSARTELTSGENAIRECLLTASRLLSISMATPLLLWAETQFTINPNS